MKAGKVEYNEYSKYNIKKLSIVELLMSNEPEKSTNMVME